MKPADPYTPADIERELENTYPKIFRTVSAMVWGSDLDPEDLTQDVFLKAVKNVHTFNRNSELYTWLYRIALNTVIDAQRRRKIRRMFSLPLFADGDDTRDLHEHSGKFASADDNPGDNRDPAENRETAEIIRVAIAQLSEPWRSVLIWREIEELSYEQIARITGESEGTLKSRLFYAKKKLREHLEKKGIRHEDL